MKRTSKIWLGLLVAVLIGATVQAYSGYSVSFGYGRGHHGWGRYGCGSRYGLGFSYYCAPPVYYYAPPPVYYYAPPPPPVYYAPSPGPAYYYSGGVMYRY